MMEDELNLNTLDGEFITVEVELKSTASNEESKCTAMEEEVICTTMEEEVICTTMEEEVICTAMDEELKCTTMEAEVICTAMEEELKCTAMEEELKCNAVKKKRRAGCQVCDKTFTNIRHRNYHMRQVHNVEPTDAKKNIICPLSDCGLKFFRRVALRDHIVQTHKIDLEEEEITFRSYDEFSQWKDDMERDTKSHYVRGQSTKFLNKGKRRYILKDYYTCHRTGFYTPNGTGKRKGRRIGSKKIGAFCPSYLIVSRSTINTFVKVVFWKKHLGHTCDMNHLSLTETEKMEIADKISKGMTFSQILNTFKESVNGPELHRINFLNRRDLSNIVQQFKINRNKPVESDDDLVSLWVKNMEEYGNDSPVAFFKKQGKEHDQLNLDDFMIVIMTKYQKEIGLKYSGRNICIDSIHGMSSHGFFLTSLLAIDENSAVFPLAFCISSRADEVSMTVFLESVKRLVGTIETPVFMSNDDQVFNDAWEKIMAPASFQLLCNWHVDSCWRRNLNKIKDKDKQASVYKILRILLEESDVFEFESLIENFVTELKNDVSTRKFAEYFCKNYFPRIKMWAFCYMRHLGISSLEQLEAMHMSLKNLFINDNEDNVYNSQVNIAIPALLKLSRDELLCRLEELLECLPIDWVDKIQKSHRQGLKVHRITPMNENSWSVKLFKRIDGHVVTANEACSKDCYLKCSKCNICIHSFFCTCFDNLINLNICGHMHACAKMAIGSKAVRDAIAEREEANQVVTDQTEMIEAEAVNEEVTETSVENEIPSSSKTLLAEASVEKEIPSSSKTLLTNQLNTIKTMMECSEYTKEQALQLKNSFDAIISFMIMHGKSNNPIIEVPYRPTNNYLSTVNKKPEAQCPNQVIAIGHPPCLYILKNFNQT